MQLLGHEIRAVAVDIDGTMASAMDVSPRGIAVLKRLEDTGIPVILVTGRSEKSAMVTAHAAGIATPVVSCNGSVVSDPVTGEYISVHTLDDDDVRGMVELAYELDMQPFVWERDWFWTDRRSGYTDQLEAINCQAFRVGPLPEKWDQVIKVMVACEAEKLDQDLPELKRFPQLRRSLSNFMEASSPDFNKWQALELVLGRLGISPENTVGFGDGEPDIQWLSNVGLSIGMENASPRLLEVVDHVIGHHRDDAAAEFLEKWLEGRL